MGTWGTGIFSDDSAADLRDDYRELIGDGAAGPEATDRLIAQWSPRGDPDLEPVFWLALALTQWSCGRLEERVKSEALRAIDSGSAIRAWLGSPDERKRRKVLEATKAKLESPQPPEQKIKKRKLATCDCIPCGSTRARGKLIIVRKQWLGTTLRPNRRPQNGEPDNRSDAIRGTSQVEHPEENVSAAKIRLSEQDFASMGPSRRTSQ